MTDWPLTSGQSFDESITADPDADTRGTILTPGAANVKGAYVDIITAANNVLGGDAILVQLESAVVDETATDISVGASGSEKILIPDIYLETMNRDCIHFLAPIKVPKGELIRARCQSEGGAASTVACTVHLLNSGFSEPPVCGGCVNWGFVSGTTRGQALTANATIHTKGAWLELVSAANNLLATRFLTLVFGVRGLATIGSANVYLDLGIGDAAAEKILIRNLALNTSGTRDGIMPAVVGPLPIQIPSGTRVAVRIQSSVASQVYDCVGYSFC